MANFDAKEIERQASRIEEQLAIFNQKAQKITSDFYQMSIIVKSEDSSLANTMAQYSETYDGLRNSLKVNFSNLAKTMHNYANNSIKNEETLSSNMSSSNKSLDEINSNVSNTDIPEIFVDFD